MDVIIQFLGKYSNLEPVFFVFALIVFFSAFIKISTVFYILRLGLGFNGIPSILVLSSLSFSLALYVMYPTIENVNLEFNNSLKSQSIGDLNTEQKKELYNSISNKWLKFIRQNTESRHINRIAQVNSNNDLKARQRESELGWRTLLPAFVISEITKAFKLGLTLFLPLLLIDLVVSTILTALDIVNIDFFLVSLPLKIFLFIAVDGWSIISTNLIKSYII